MARHHGDLDDDDLMSAYAEGDEDAFSELYGRWERRVYGFCLRMLAAPDRAADAFQDTFRRVIEAADRFQRQGRFESWLFTLARRACVDQMRSASDQATPSDSLSDHPTLSSDPVDTEARLVREDRLGRLLTSLTGAQREALLLSKYHGFSYREVAESTGSTEAAVKQMVYRALKDLRERYPELAATDMPGES